MTMMAEMKATLVEVRQGVRVRVRLAPKTQAQAQAPKPKPKPKPKPNPKPKLKPKPDSPFPSPNSQSQAYPQAPSYQVRALPGGAKGERAALRRALRRLRQEQDPVDPAPAAARLYVPRDAEDIRHPLPARRLDRATDASQRVGRGLGHVGWRPGTRGVAAWDTWGCSLTRRTWGCSSEEATC